MTDGRRARRGHRRPGAATWSEDELAAAIATDEFFLLYQPTIDLQSNAFVGVEALLRWRHPRLGRARAGRVPSCARGERRDRRGRRLGHPDRLLPGGELALERAPLLGLGERAARQLAASSFVRDVDRASRTAGSTPHTSCSSSPSARCPSFPTCRRCSAGLKLLGRAARGRRLRIAEPTSRGTRLDLPIDVVKIDRSYITGLSTSPGDAARVHDLVQLGKAAARSDCRPRRGGRRPAPCAARRARRPRSGILVLGAPRGGGDRSLPRGLRHLLGEAALSSTSTVRDAPVAACARTGGRPR